MLAKTVKDITNFRKYKRKLVLHEKYILQLFNNYTNIWQIIYYLFTYVIFASAIIFTKTILY